MNRVYAQRHDWTPDSRLETHSSSRIVSLAIGYTMILALPLSNNRWSKIEKHDYVGYILMSQISLYCESRSKFFQEIIFNFTFSYLLRDQIFSRLRIRIKRDFESIGLFEAGELFYETILEDKFSV